MPRRSLDDCPDEEAIGRQIQFINEEHTKALKAGDWDAIFFYQGMYRVLMWLKRYHGYTRIDLEVPYHLREVWEKPGP